jgi:OmpA-OmpF porin, OOP family
MKVNMSRVRGWCAGLSLAWMALAFGQSTDGGIAGLISAQQQLQQERAELLAPRNFVKIADELKDLQKYVNNQAKPEKIQKQQAVTQQAVDKTTQTIALSNKTLQTVIKAYDDALTAGADKSQDKTLNEAWRKADQRFKSAVNEVEGNDLDDARKKGAEAEVMLRDVELAAIKNTVLGAARTLIAKGRENKLSDVVPRSFAVAEQQLNLAEQQLSRNRYELDEPTKLAAQAVYEARHAQYLFDLINAAADGRKTQVAETQWLALEQPLKELVTELGVVAKFDEGYTAAMTEARAKVRQQQEDLVAARQTIRNREQDIADLKSQLVDTNAALKKMETKLGGESEERLALQKKLSSQERLRDNVAKVEGMFTSDEGRVYRQGDEMVISLTGVNFRSGKSTIEPDSFMLLGKLGEAIKLFPDAGLTVEGHTDNQGSDSANLLLSQDRADAVRQYLISNLGANAEKITSIGYGKAKPVTSNDTEAGRARNRRIDVVMKIDGL